MEASSPGAQAEPRETVDDDKTALHALERGMIVCSCTMITSKDIAEAVSALRTNDPHVVLTPGLIYRQLGKRPSCGGCLPLITRLMVSYDEGGPSVGASLPHHSPIEDT